MICRAVIPSTVAFYVYGIVKLEKTFLLGKNDRVNNKYSPIKMDVNQKPLIERNNAILEHLHKRIRINEKFCESS